MVTNNYIYAETVSDLFLINEILMKVFQVLSLMQFSDNDALTEDFIVETMQPNLNFIYRNYDALRQWFSTRNLSIK